MQFKSSVKLSTVIGLITKLADGRMTLNYSQYVCDVFLVFETDQKISPTDNRFEFVY